MPNQTALISSTGLEIINKGFTIVTSKVLVSLFILFIGFVLAKIVEKALRRFLKTIEIDKYVKKLSGFRIQLEDIISNIILYIIYFATFVMALDNLGIASNVINIVLWAVIIMITISFFLAIKDIVPNAIQGIVILKKGVIKLGSKIKLDDIEGIVIEIDLTQTNIQTKEGDLIIVPNSLIMSKLVIIKR